ncbi:MAG: hypothetical protein IJY31_08105 [Muribaculaceae bacterium]|nr:hypothetical protein [Muribaculaceae bacterium]
MRRLERRIYLPVVLLVMFLSYHAGISLFAHTHVVNGALIVHSHPFAKNTHNHSDSQVVAFNHAANFQGMEADLSTPVVVEWHELLELRCSRDTYHRVLACVTGINLRAPPCC